MPERQRTDDGTAAFAKLSPTTPEIQKFVTDYKALLAEISASAKGQESAAKGYAEIHKKR